MKKFQKLYQLKQLIKADSEFQKYCRLTRKLEYNPEYDAKLKEAQANCVLHNIHSIYMDSRIIHIAYSLLKNKSYQQIENKTRQNKILSEYEWKKIVDIMQKYKDEENLSVIPSIPYPTTEISIPKVKSNEVC